MYNSLFFYDHNEIPLSVIELFQMVRSHTPVHFTSFNATMPIVAANVQRNYLDLDTIPFLICNYSNTTYDSFLRYTRPRIPVFVTHFALYMLGKSYHYRFPLDDYRKIFS